MKAVQQTGDSRLGLWVAHVERMLAEQGSEERRQVAVTYFPTAMRVLGVPVPALRAVAKAIAKELKAQSPEVVLSHALALVEAGTMEGRQVAYEILEAHKPTAQALVAADIERLRIGLDNWASVDSFAASVAGPAWRRGQISDGVIDRWAQSPDRFVRRLALVCTVALNMRSRGGKGDALRTLHVCRKLAGDKDEFVVKALSWALRELLPHDEPAVRVFIREHDDRLSRRVVREIQNKLTKGTKN